MECDRLSHVLEQVRRGKLTAAAWDAAFTHVRRCPRCAHRPGLEALLSMPRPSLGRPSPSASPSGAIAEEQPGNGLAVLMIFGVVVAVAFAGREAFRIVEALRRPADSGGALAPALVGARGEGAVRLPRGVTEPQSPAPTVPQAGPKVLQEARAYVKRVRDLDVDAPEAGVRLSAELVGQLSQGGTLDRLRQARGERGGVDARELSQMEAILLRAAAAQGRRREWLAIQETIDKLDLGRLRERVEPKAEGRTGP